MCNVASSSYQMPFRMYAYIESQQHIFLSSFSRFRRIFEFQSDFWFSFLLIFFCFLCFFTHAHLISYAPVSFCFIFDLFTLSMAFVFRFFHHLFSPSPVFSFTFTYAAVDFLVFFVTLMWTNTPHDSSYSHYTLQRAIFYICRLHTVLHLCCYWLWEQRESSIGLFCVLVSIISHCNDITQFQLWKIPIFSQNCEQSAEPFTYWNWNWQCSFLLPPRSNPESPNVDLLVFIYFASVFEATMDLKGRTTRVGEREHFPLSANREQRYFTRYFYPIFFCILFQFYFFRILCTYILGMVCFLLVLSRLLWHNNGKNNRNSVKMTYSQSNTMVCGTKTVHS